MRTLRPLMERIQSRCETVGECWIWRGALKRGKSVPTPIFNAKIFVRRAVYEECVRKLPDLTWRVVNACGDPLCVRPEHQKALSASEFTTLANKNRVRRTWGAAISRAREYRLRPIVGEIRERLNAGETGVSIAARYGISTSAVSDLKKGRTWREVSPWSV